MAKFDPLKPPMSLKESERLLKAEKDRLDRQDDRKGFVAILGGIAALVAIVAIVVSLLTGFVG